MAAETIWCHVGARSGPEERSRDLPCGWPEAQWDPPNDLQLSRRSSGGTARSWRRLAAAGVRVTVDQREETVGRRVRDAELLRVPHVIVYGDRDAEDALPVRTRGVEDVRIWTVDTLVADLATL